MALDPWVERGGKIAFGAVQTLLGMALVWLGTFRFLERTMTCLVALMIVVVVATGVMIGPDWGAVLQGLLVPTSQRAGGLGWKVAS